MKTGFIKTAAVSPELKVANTSFNTDQIIACAQNAAGGGAGIIVFPELAITSASCGDLFRQESLYQKNLDGLMQIVDASRNINAILVVGFYLRLDGSYYSCAAVIQDASLMGIVPKMYRPVRREADSAPVFAPGFRRAADTPQVTVFHDIVPFGNLLFYDDKNDITFGVEVNQDFWTPFTPGTRLAMNGAQIILNTGASFESTGRADARRRRIAAQSEAVPCGYVFASAGTGESTTDRVYGGHCLIAENGTLLGETGCMEPDSTIVYSEIDYATLRSLQADDPALEEAASLSGDRETLTWVKMKPFRTVEADQKLSRHIEKNPFVPEDASERDARCKEAFAIQTAALIRRVQHTGAKNLTIGISGGLDSALALLVSVQAARTLGWEPSQVTAVTMPGFGTTDRTYENALDIMRLLGTDVREIPIGDAVLAHFAAIGHDPSVHDVTYENAQARERTQILMDLSGDLGGFVVGTGDLSEAALGWCTFNGDHMAMYDVNISIPKTMIRAVVRWIADNVLTGPEENPAFSSDNARLREALYDIMETPISPELLPPDSDGQMTQKTEDRVGPYSLHDFFLYYTVQMGMQPERVQYLAEQVFAGEFDPDYIRHWLREFYRRFFSQQFKRNCTPDGPKVCTVDLSPRGSWNMPSDADSADWLQIFDKQN